MEKSVSFRISKKEYTKCLLAQFFNIKCFLFCYVIFVIVQIPQIIKNLSFSFIFANLMMTFVPTFFSFGCYYFMMIFYGIYIYNRDPILKSEITIKFNEHDFEEITIYSSYKLKYNDVYQIKILKSVLLIYISPARLFIIPKRHNYDIKEIYLELKKLKEKKTI